MRLALFTSLFTFFIWSCKDNKANINQTKINTNYIQNSRIERDLNVWWKNFPSYHSINPNQSFKTVAKLIIQKYSRQEKIFNHSYRGDNAED